MKCKKDEADSITPMFDEVSESLRRMAMRLDQIEDHISRVGAPAGTEIDDAAEKISRIEDENRALREEIGELKEELLRGRTEGASVDPQMIKSRAEEIDSLKATIVSNERGLALLREEVNEKNNLVREKDREIMQLLEKMREMESLRKQARPEQKRQSLLGGLIKGPPTSSGRP